MSTETPSDIRNGVIDSVNGVKIGYALLLLVSDRLKHYWTLHGVEYDFSLSEQIDAAIDAARSEVKQK